MILRKYFRLHILQIAIALISVIVFSSCRREDDPQQPEPPAKENTHRTVLVYMLAASNGLGSSAPYDYDRQDIDEMLTAAKAGDLGDGRLLVFHSASNGNQVLKEISSEGVDTLKIYDSTVLPQSSRRMSEVFDDMEKLAPANDYGLVLWGHGTGWLQDGTAETDSQLQTYSYGSEHNDKWKMSITTLAATVEGRPFSFLYMDCCFMASVEVVYQMRNAFEMIVASPTEVPCEGMPYDKNIKCFFNAEPDLIQSAKNTMDFYRAKYSQRENWCTITVLNTRGLDGLAAATRRIYELNGVGLPAGYTPQIYKPGSKCYYFDFGSYVRALDCDEALLTEFDEALASVVVYEDATEYICGAWGWFDITEHSGLSSYIIMNSSNVNLMNYDQLDWYKDVASTLIKY